MRLLRSVLLLSLAFLFAGPVWAQRRMNTELCALALKTKPKAIHGDKLEPRVDIVDLGFIESRLSQIQKQIIESVQGLQGARIRYEALLIDLRNRKADWPEVQEKAKESSGWFKIKVNNRAYSKEEVNAGEEKFWILSAKKTVVELDQFTQKFEILSIEEEDLQKRWAKALDISLKDNQKLLDRAADSLEKNVERMKDTDNGIFAQSATTELKGIDSSNEMQVRLDQAQSRSLLGEAAGRLLIRESVIPSIKDLQSQFERLFF